MFLVAVPRRHSPGSSPEREGGRIEELLEAVRDSYLKQLDDLPGHQVRIASVGGNDETRVLMLKKVVEASNASLKRGFWAVAAGHHVAEDLVDTISRRAGRIIYERPVWGSYAAVYGERYAGRVTAWNTTPTVEAIHYGQTSEFTFISNRPLLVALALNAGAVGAVRLSREYLTEYLLYGYSMTGQSPYESVFILPAGKSLSVVEGEISINEFPEGLIGGPTKFHTTEEAAPVLADALRNSMRRSLKLLDGRKLQVRASGGKDSRILFALLRGEDVNAYAVTYGRPSDDEVAVARYIAENAGIELEAKSPTLMEGATFQEKVENVLRLCDGMPLSEPHASIYVGSDAKSFGEGIMLGQWPLMKGGAAKRMHYSEEEIVKKIRGQAAEIVRQPEREPYDSFFEGWLINRPASSEIEKLYLFSRDFRSSRWMLALTCMYDRDATVTYPLADAEVAAVSDSLTMGEKIAQTAYFLALEQIWPEAVAIPLVGSIWKFEATGPVEGYAPQEFEARNRSVAQFVVDKIGLKNEEVSTDKSIEFLTATAVELSKEIIESSFAGLFQSILKDDFWEVIKCWSHGEQELYLGYSRRVVIQLIWRVYVADIWYRREWLRS